MDAFGFVYVMEESEMAQRGSIIDNKYEILKEIGRGGMSIVYLAMDKRLNKQWAIKEIRKDARDEYSKVNVQALIKEANLMKRLDHPALPRIVDIIDDGELIYIVMDYIEGESLDRILRDNGPQPQELVIDWGKQLCDVLRYLHNQEPPIIYRDMKPANAMLKPEGKVKLIDFGIAKEYKENSNRDTQPLGTKGYAAPEQFGSNCYSDQRTDIFCLGVTLYHLVTGHNLEEFPYEIYPIRKWNPSLSPGLEKIIGKCMQMNPMDRYQNCDELMYALEHYTEIDDSFIKKQKKKLYRFLTLLSISVFSFIASITAKTLSTKQNNMLYEQLVNVSKSTNYEIKIESYEDAIELYPERTDAYVKMLEAYSDNGQFGNEESTQFLTYYNSVFGTVEQGSNSISDSVAELNYEAGILYFYMYYDEDADNVLKTRAIKALPFFESIINYADKKYEKYDLVQNYYTVCKFYKDYIGNISNTKEPTKETYNDLLISLESSIENLNQCDYEDMSHIKLTIYESVVAMVYDQRKGLYETGVEQDTVINLLNYIFDDAEKLVVLQEINKNMKEELMNKKDQCLSDINSLYEKKGD